MIIFKKKYMFSSSVYSLKIFVFVVHVIDTRYFIFIYLYIYIVATFVYAYEIISSAITQLLSGSKINN